MLTSHIVATKLTVPTNPPHANQQKPEYKIILISVMPISAATFLSSVQKVAVPATATNIVGQTAHLLHTDGETMGAVVRLDLANGPSVYLWSSGRAYFHGAATAAQQAAVNSWIAALSKG